MSEETCNPTCVPYTNPSWLRNTALVRHHALRHRIDKKEDMRFSVCFGRTSGKMYFDAYDPAVAVGVSLLPPP